MITHARISIRLPKNTLPSRMLDEVSARIKKKVKGDVVRFAIIDAKKNLIVIDASVWKRKR